MREYASVFIAGSCCSAIGCGDDVTVTPCTRMRAGGAGFGAITIGASAGAGSASAFFFVSTRSFSTAFGASASLSERVAPDPHLPYSLVKRQIEVLLEYYRHCGLDSTILRFSNVYGPGGPRAGTQGFVTIVASALLHGTQPTLVGDGTTVRDFLYITDAVEALVRRLGSA